MNSSNSGDSGNESSAEVTLAPAGERESPIPQSSGGYVWPVPFAEQMTMHSRGGGGGEYVGPLFRHPADDNDL